MARRSPKHKPKMERISIAELEADPTMVGFTSLFRIPTTQAALPHVAAALDRMAEPTAGDGSIPTVGSEPNPTVVSVAPPTEGLVSPPQSTTLQPKAEPTEGVGSTPTA